MYNDTYKKINESFNLKKDSRLSIYTNNDLDLFIDVKNLNKLSAHYFLFLLLDRLIEEKIIDKKILLDMINHIL